MLLYGSLQLLDVLSPSFSEGGLRLPVPLLAFLGGCVDLEYRQADSYTEEKWV